MLYGVGHADRSALRHAQQRERLLQAGRFDDCFQILDPALEREVADVQVGHPTAALVVTNVVVVVTEETYPVSPDWALPLVLEVRQPVRGLDHHRSCARFGPG